MNCVCEPADEEVLGSFDKDGFTATRPLASLSTTGESSARAGVVHAFLRSAYRRGMWVGRAIRSKKCHSPEAAVHECRDRVNLSHSRLIAAIHLGTVAHG